MLSLSLATVFNLHNGVTHMSKNTGQSTSIMESRTITGLKGLAVIGSVLVYLLIVVYAEYHFFNLISGFVPGGMQVVGMIAVAASGITAILLPVAIHFWFRSGLQLIVGFIFYGIHFLMMFANLILDSSLQGTAIADTPDWIVTVYAPYILPGYIAFYALAWSILWFVDSNSQRIDKRREVEQIEEDGRLDRQISLANFRSNALTAAFNSQAAQETVNRLIATQAPALLAQELGLSVEELGPTQDFEFWMRPADPGNQQPPQPNSKNIVAAAGSAAPTTRPRERSSIQTEPLSDHDESSDEKARFRALMRPERPKTAYKVRLEDVDGRVDELFLNTVDEVSQAIADNTQYRRIVYQYDADLGYHVERRRIAPKLSDTQASPSPSLNRSTIPHTRPHIRPTPKTLSEFLATAGMTAEEARNQLQKRDLTTPEKAYDVMYRFGAIPRAMTREEFDPLFAELMNLQGSGNVRQQGNGVEKDSPLAPTGTRPE